MNINKLVSHEILYIINHNIYAKKLDEIAK